MINKMHNRRKDHHQFIVILLMLSMILLQISFPASLAAMDLMEAYIRAKDNDPSFGSSAFEHEAAQTLPAQGLSLLLPQIQGYSTESRYYYDDAPLYYKDFRSETTGASLKQPIFNVAKFYEYRQNKIRGLIGDYKFVSAAQDLILRVAEAYFNGLAAKNLLEPIDMEKQAVMEQREQAKRMFQAGIATITDVHNTDARYDSVLAKEIEAKKDLDIKIQALKRIIGVEPDGLSPLKEDIILAVPEPDSLEGWIEKAKIHHPLLKAYAHQITYREAELRKIKGAHLPSIDLVGGYNKTNTSNHEEIDTLSYGSVGVQISLPIFSGGYTTAKVKEARALLGQSRKEYESNLADITQKISEAFLGIRGNIARISALQVANKSASTSVTSNKMSLLAGVRTTIDVLNAERDLQDVRSRLIQARYECLLNIVKLKASAGIISEMDLREINQWLQTAAVQ